MTDFLFSLPDATSFAIGTKNITSYMMQNGRQCQNHGGILVLVSILVGTTSLILTMIYSSADRLTIPSHLSSQYQQVKIKYACFKNI